MFCVKIKGLNQISKLLQGLLVYEVFSVYFMTSYQYVLELEFYLDNLFILFELSLGFIKISRSCFGFFVLDHAFKKICDDICLGPWHVIGTQIQSR